MSCQCATQAGSATPGWPPGRVAASTVCWVAAVSLAVAGCSSGNSDSAPRRRAKAKAIASVPALPPVRQAQFRNTGADAKYVGNQACVECHTDEHDSYVHTTHSLALSKIDLQQEPPDAEFTHELSGRSYRIYRDQDELRHREFLKAEDGTELVLADHAMQYAMGSGNHSRSYLLEIDGFLFESPLTWYAARDGWGMSPGYEDDPTQPGFARTAMRDCVICHAGTVATVDRSAHKLRIDEMAIGCERCHGPGSLHVQRRRGDAEVTADFDDTIVHPSRLPRDLQEAICGQCHLASEAEANVRGRQLADFRPSLHLNDFRVRFKPESNDDAMTVVGHIEQMRASRCYQMSAAMTCTTCHHMHGNSAGGDVRHHPGAAGRESCLSCHETEACGLEPAERHQRSSDDNCITCHMPKADTDIPHFAFHHHRIGIHAKPTAPADTSDSPTKKRFAKLVPIDDLSHLPEHEQKRCQGLAYMKLAEEGEFDNPSLHYEVAAQLLEEFRDSGIRDAEVDATLARIYLRNGQKILATHRGQSALLADGLTDDLRRDAVGVLSRIYANDREFEFAQPFLEELIQFRYAAEDHLILSICRQRGGDLPGALQAAQAAVKLEPDRPDLHIAVSQMYTLTGDDQQAAWHQERADQLHKLLKAVVGDELE